MVGRGGGGGGGGFAPGATVGAAGGAAAAAEAEDLPPTLSCPGELSGDVSESWQRETRRRQRRTMMSRTGSRASRHIQVGCCSSLMESPRTARTTDVTYPPVVEAAYPASEGAPGTDDEAALRADKSVSLDENAEMRPPRRPSPPSSPPLPPPPPWRRSRALSGPSVASLSLLSAAKSRAPAACRVCCCCCGCPAAPKACRSSCARVRGASGVSSPAGR